MCNAKEGLGQEVPTAMQILFLTSVNLILNSNQLQLRENKSCLTFIFVLNNLI